jgi:hypothetical protein
LENCKRSDSYKNMTRQNNRTVKRDVIKHWNKSRGSEE